jgi:predicted Zn-dependent peptidase
LALSVMADVSLYPTFAPVDLDRLREERLAGRKQARDFPPAIAAAAFPLLVYGSNHRYGTGTTGTEETLLGFTADDLRAFHERFFRPDNAALVVVGDVTPDAVLVELERAFGAWTAGGTPPQPPVLPALPEAAARTVYLVDKPGAAQSVIRIGGVGVPRSTPDYFAIEVLNTILGGSFSSRLNQNLREEHGYTYGARSGFAMRLEAGPFVATASVQTDKTAESITEFFTELEGIGEPVPAAELRKAKNYLTLSYPGEFETTRDIAGQLGEQIVYRLPDDDLSTYVQRIEAVTADDVARVAAKYITPDRFAVVVVGDRQVVQAPIEALGLGEVKVLSVDDVVK